MKGKEKACNKKDKNVYDWKPLASEVGKALRELIIEGGELISKKIISEINNTELLCKKNPYVSKFIFFNSLFFI